MAAGRVRYGAWLLRLVTWDGLMPACIALAPLGIAFWFPNRRGVMEVAAVAWPITAFLLRVDAGRHHIAGNHCSEAFRRFQFGAFCFGLLPLVLFDCFMVLSHLMPAGAMFATEGDRMM